MIVNPRTSSDAGGSGEEATWEDRSVTILHLQLIKHQPQEGPHSHTCVAAAKMLLRHAFIHRDARQA